MLAPATISGGPGFQVGEAVVTASAPTGTTGAFSITGGGGGAGDGGGGDGGAAMGAGAGAAGTGGSPLLHAAVTTPRANAAATPARFMRRAYRAYANRNFSSPTSRSTSCTSSRCIGTCTTRAPGPPAACS